MNLEIRPLECGNLKDADRIFRLAFGTFLALPDPLSFGGDSDYVNTRWNAAPTAALGAYVDGELVGSNFLANWGSFGFFGPLTVRPDLWDKGVSRALLAETIPLFDAMGVRHTALFTFPQSPRHVAIYQKFEYWPQQLTALMFKAVEGSTNAYAWRALSDIPPEGRGFQLEACRALADTLYSGLDLSREISSVAEQRLGDTVLVHEGGELAAFAICHLGAGSEAGSGTAYIKFGGTRAGDGAARRLDRLLASCEALAASRGIAQLIVGVNTARHTAYRLMLERGFRTMLHGIAMQRYNEPGYNHADCFILDDWR